MNAQAMEGEAIDLAHRFQLVTSVSGAVVLETEQQYLVTGLSPSTHDSVPSISTPDTGATWMLPLTACGVLALVARHRAS